MFRQEAAYKKMTFFGEGAPLAAAVAVGMTGKMKRRRGGRRAERICPVGMTEV